MVLNEAATAGLPLVATDGVGAAHELSRTASTASACPSATSARSRRRCAGSPTTRRFRTAAGARSRELVARLTPEAWAEGVAGLARRLSRSS